METKHLILPGGHGLETGLSDHRQTYPCGHNSYFALGTRAAVNCAFSPALFAAGGSAALLSSVKDSEHSPSSRHHQRRRLLAENAHLIAARVLGRMAMVLALTFSLGAKPQPRDPSATLAAARDLAERGAWTEAASLLTPVVDPEGAGADAVALLSRTVLEAGDLRRARLLSERALLRFPEDLRFRRLDLAVLIARREWKEAEAAARSVLAQSPNDSIAWRQLAAAAIEVSDEAEKRAVLEAAHLANPDDPVVLEKHLLAQFLGGHRFRAETLAEAALSHPKIRPTVEFVTLCVRVAEASENYGLAKKWLSQIAAEDRDRTLTLLEARLALRGKDRTTARRALLRLIERGQGSPEILVRAGKLAEEDGEMGRAEALYAQASEGDGEAAQIAKLTYARFLAKVGNHDRAQQILRAYLVEHPSDAYARQLLGITRRHAAAEAE